MFGADAAMMGSGYQVSLHTRTNWPVRRGAFDLTAPWPVAVLDSSSRPAA